VVEHELRGVEPEMIDWFWTYLFGTEEREEMGRRYRPIGWVMHEYDGAPWGTRMRSTFRLPGSLLRVVRDSLRKHCLEEMGEFARFLPELCRAERR